MTALVDTHLHFDDFAAEGLVPEILESAADAGLEWMVAVGGNPAANALAIETAREHPGKVLCACGFDRDLANASMDMSELSDQLDGEHVVAVGECGLDYYYEPDTALKQRKLFEDNLALAIEKSLPVVVHSRDADEDTVAILKAYAAACPTSFTPGVLHCYTRTVAMARNLLDIGFFISFSGIVTFKNADELRAVAAYVPEDRLVIETDSPYLAPVPMRGKRNQPAYLVHVAQAVAAARGGSLENIAASTALNSKTLFRLP